MLFVKGFKIPRKNKFLFFVLKGQKESVRVDMVTVYVFTRLPSTEEMIMLSRLKKNS